MINKNECAAMFESLSSSFLPLASPKGREGGRLVGRGVTDKPRWQLHNIDCHKHNMYALERDSVYTVPYAWGH